AGNRLRGALAGTRVGVGTLTAHRQSTAMTQAAIAAKIHQTLNVDADFTTKITFDEIVAVNHFTDLQNFLISQLGNPTLDGNAYFFNDLGRVFRANTMNVLQRDQNAFVGRNIYTGDTGHG